ncbi:MAG: biotin carboxylase N-terminal domain-containing protein [Paracoccaceae bacterium]
MIRRLLIANRGEIAVRIAATARRMGIATVAVFSDADADALHTAAADTAHRIGPPPARLSYLNAEAILAAARAAGADAVHPGYGFLSENADFAEAVANAGLIWVGPPPAAIRAMGLKDAAKRLMQAAGVPVVPGFHDAGATDAQLASAALTIGFPVLIKARAGGGGRGMRRVDAPDGFAAALASARREAESAFGDPECLVEKLIASPRHIEMQILADSHGQVLHLLERDCSLQRRHQKVIEEAPAPGMTPDMRAAMGRAATEAARAVSYVGAGTVEFIVDGAQGLHPDHFWFMEMNTRLQVEHPVTEAVTGLDLVEWQLRVAAGEALSFRQEDIAPQGHAVEARLYAEDPARDFRPATGWLDRLAFPPAAAFARAPLRVDSGVREGDSVTPHYDAMIAKVIAHAPTRGEALSRLATALDTTEIAGIVTNRAFLARLLRHPGVVAGELDTGLIGRELDALAAPPVPGPGVRALAAVATLGLDRPTEGDSPWDRLRGFRVWGAARHAAAFALDGETVAATVTLQPTGFRVEFSGEVADLSLCPEVGGALSVRAGDLAFATRIVRHDAHRLTLLAGGETFTLVLPDPLAGATDDHPGGDDIRAPLPGLLRALTAEPGARVAKGTPLAMIEAMKMEHALTAHRDGSVAEVLARAGDQVAEGQVLIRLAVTDPKDVPDV